MDDTQETEKFITENQEMESFENPFIKLAPEVVEHILNFLSDIPHKMLASGVCRLWRELVNWKKVKQLDLDFAHLHINDVPLPLSKWSAALESLLPKVTLTSLQVILPNKTPPKLGKRGFYLPWPLSLLDCVVVLNQRTNQQQASFSHITHVGISGPPDNPQFELSCHLLELCPSVTHLYIKLNSDQFDFGLLKSALTNKPLVELSLNLEHLMVEGNCASADLAHLCRVLAPGTLKSLTLVTGNRHTAENLYHRVFCFDVWCRALGGATPALSAVEQLSIGASHFAVSNELLPDTLHLPFVQLLHQIMPSLKNVDFSIPLVDTGIWPKMYIAIECMSLFLHHKVDVRLLTSHCTTSFIYLNLHQQYGAGIKILTETGFHITADTLTDAQPHMTVTYERMLPTAPSACRCNVCLSEFHWVKGSIIGHLERIRKDGIGSQASAVDDFQIFSCTIPRLRSELQQIYPTLRISKVVKGLVKIAVDGNVVLTAEGFMHNSDTVGGLYDDDDDPCAGCVMMMI